MSVDLLDAQGKPIRTSETHVEYSTELPGWVYGIGYRADDDITTIRVMVPESSVARSHILAFESTSEQLRALRDAIDKCLSQSEKTLQVLDVQPEESSG